MRWYQFPQVFATVTSYYGGLHYPQVSIAGMDRTSCYIRYCEWKKKRKKDKPTIWFLRRYCTVLPDFTVFPASSDFHPVLLHLVYHTLATQPRACGVGWRGAVSPPSSLLATSRYQVLAVSLHNLSRLLLHFITPLKILCIFSPWSDHRCWEANLLASNLFSLHSVWLLRKTLTWWLWPQAQDFSLSLV